MSLGIFVFLPASALCLSVIHRSYTGLIASHQKVQEAMQAATAQTQTARQLCSQDTFDQFQNMSPLVALEQSVKVLQSTQQALQLLARSMQAYRNNSRGGNTASNTSGLSVQGMSGMGAQGGVPLSQQVMVGGVDDRRGSMASEHGSHRVSTNGENMGGLNMMCGGGGVDQQQVVGHHQVQQQHSTMQSPANSIHSSGGVAMPLGLQGSQIASSSANAFAGMHGVRFVTEVSQKVSAAVIFYTKSSSELTFENYYLLLLLLS